MKRNKMTLQWEGSFIELCMGRVTRFQKKQIDIRCTDVSKPLETLWYEDSGLLKAVFDADNWWSVDDLDHAMGLVFSDRAALDTALATIACEIDGSPATVDPEAFQLSFYAPEGFDPPGEDEMVVCHGSRREAVLHLHTDFQPPFDPSLITLSFLHYPDYGYILIDLDYDGHDDVELTLGTPTHLNPRFIGKDRLDGTPS